MNGKLTHTLNTHTVIFARVGSARNSGVPRPSACARLGSGLCGVATSQFHAVDDTTMGTTQGSSSSVLNTARPGRRVRSSNANPNPTDQLPNTPTTVKISVKTTARQNAGLLNVEA